MAIHAKVFPLDMSGIEGGPEFKTEIIQGLNNQEVRNSLWQDPLWRYNAKFAVKSRADVSTLIAFFLTVRGREIAFLLEAKDDFKIPQTGSTPQLIGTGTGGQTAFQIVKRYTDAIGTVFQRTILRPSATSAHLQVYLNDVLQGSGYSYSSTTGVITFSSPPGNGVTVKVVLSKFHVPVRFDIDHLAPEMFRMWVDASGDRSQHQLPDIPLQEVRDLT